MTFLELLQDLWNFHDGNNPKQRQIPLKAPRMSGHLWTPAEIDPTGRLSKLLRQKISLSSLHLWQRCIRSGRPHNFVQPLGKFQKWKLSSWGEMDWCRAKTKRKNNFRVLNRPSSLTCANRKWSWTMLSDSPEEISANGWLLFSFLPWVPLGPAPTLSNLPHSLHANEVNTLASTKFIQLILAWYSYSHVLPPSHVMPDFKLEHNRLPIDDFNLAQLPTVRNGFNNGLP